MKNIIKKISLFVLSFLIIVALVGCSFSEKEPEKSDHAPVFHGVEDIVIEKGSTFSPLEGVSVTDEEDGNINLSAVTVDARSVNPNVEGEYFVTYTVFDSDANKVVVERKVTVVYIDREEPVLYGVADTIITVGDVLFNKVRGVSAEDLIDGTVDFTCTGEVDIWTEGEYMLHYSAKDSAGNEATADRKVTVNLGYFEFGELIDLDQSGQISGGQIYASIAPYSLVKFVLVLNGDNAKVRLQIEGVQSSNKEIEVNGETEITVYGRLDEVLENAQCSIQADKQVQVISAKYAFAEAGDHVPPVITRKAEGKVALPAGISAEAALIEILNGVTSEDEVEGNLTQGITVDLTNVKLNEAGDYVAVIKSADSIGNEATLEVEIMVAVPKDTHVMTDPEFNEDSTTQIVCTHNAGGSVVEEIKDGMYVLNITTAGGWASGDSPYLSGITTDKLAAEHYYVFMVDVKADVARTIQIRAGLELWADPWIENFRDTVKYDITDEWQTIYYMFYVPSATSSVGSKTIKFEIQCGSIYWAAGENNNVLYFDNMQFYLLSNDNKAPEIELVEGLPTTFGKNAELPDFKTYFKVSDLEDGEIEITDNMLDLSALNAAEAGTYVIKCTVFDSEGVKAEKELAIKILEEADTEGPVISIPGIVITTLESYMPVSEGTDLTDKFEMVLSYVTITDNVDGNITPTLAMIDLGELNISSANAGEFDVVMQTKDSSGNLSNQITFHIIVKDSQPPVLIGARDLTLFKGDIFNPFASVCGYDTNDGIVHLGIANLVGFEELLNEQGEVIAEPGEYQAGYVLADASGNEVEKSIVITVLAAVEFNEAAAIDLLGQKTTSTGPSSSTIEYTDDEGILTYNGAEGWWASYCQIKYYGVELIPNAVHKLVITAKAALPREFNIYFVDGDANKIPGFDVDNNKLTVGLTDQYSTFEYVFTPTSASSASSVFEMDFDWESFLFNSQQENVISFKEIKIVFVGEAPEQPGNPNDNPEERTYEDEPTLKLDFEEYTSDQDFQEAHWTVERYTSQWDVMQSVQMRIRGKDGTRVVNMYSGGSMTMRYTYTPDDILENIGKVTFKLGNYFNGAQVAPIKVAVIHEDDSVEYLVGSTDDFYQFHVTTGLEQFECELNAVKNIKAIRFVFKSPASSAYIYLDDLSFFKVVEE